MNSLSKYLIALVIGVILGAGAIFYVDRCPEPVTTVVTQTDTIYKTVVDSTEIKFLKEELTKAKANVETVIINVPAENPMGGESVFTEVETQKYTGTEELDNGTIGYEIYADSLYAYKFTLEAKETIINNTTTITKWDTRSRLYLGGGLDFNVVNKLPEAASVGLMYNRKQRWAVGVAIGNNFSGLLPVENATTVGVKFWWGLGKRKQ